MSAFTSKRDILSRAKMELGIADITNHDALLKDIMNEYIRTFDCFETYVKTCATLEKLGNGVFCLPDNFYELGILKATCTTQNNYNQNFETPFVYVDSVNLHNWGYSFNNNNNWSTGSYQINGDRIELMGGFQNIKSLTLLYKAYNTDKYGNFINVPKDFYVAVVKRVVADFMGLPFNERKYMQQTIQRYDAQAVAMFNMVKAKSARRDMQRRMAEMQDVSTSLLSDMNILPR